MASLAELSQLVGFFSYSREDDEDFRGELSAIRAAIGRNLAALLARSKLQNFRRWQDVEAIAPGKMWETEIAKAIGESAFFIPIVTPRAVASPHCKCEFESFLAREQALGRNDLVFPILYIQVPSLKDEARGATIECRQSSPNANSSTGVRSATSTSIQLLSAKRLGIFARRSPRRCAKLGFRRSNVGSLRNPGSAMTRLRSNDGGHPAQRAATKSKELHRGLACRIGAGR